MPNADSIRCFATLLRDCPVCVVNVGSAWSEDDEYALKNERFAFRSIFCAKAYRNNCCILGIGVVISNESKRFDKWRSRTKVSVYFPRTSAPRG